MAGVDHVFKLKAIPGTLKVDVAASVSTSVIAPIEKQGSFSMRIKARLLIVLRHAQAESAKKKD